MSRAPTIDEPLTDAEQFEQECPVTEDERDNELRPAGERELLGLAPRDVVTNAIKMKDVDGKAGLGVLSLVQILARTRIQTGDWPRRVGNQLFVNDDYGISFFDRPDGLFGWFHHTVGRVAWHRGVGTVSRAELFAEWQRTATSYDAVESMPHEPKLPRTYYSHEPIPSGNGEALRELVSRFSPATDIDGDLILAAFLTPGWGGPPGCRPCFVITSDDGRGAGKSTVAEMVGRVWKGVLSFSAAEDINKIKTRLLSTDALTQRVSLLDNVKSLKFSWAELEGMITANTIGGHRMYVGEATRPNTLCWFITLNGASLSTDMAQRAVVIKVKRPPRSATWLEDIQRFIDKNRDKIIADIMGILRGPATPLTKFTRWASWEREILGRLPEPLEAQVVIAERQNAVDVETDEVALIEDHFATQLKWLDYDPESDKVFVPSNLAARWYGDATNERKSTVAIGRVLSQLCTEGRCTKLQRNANHALGRGFIWTPTAESAMSDTLTDIRERLTDKLAERDR